VSNRLSTILLLAALLMPYARPATAAPFGRAFTYQGQLSQSGVPVEGTVILRFSLWDAAGSGSPPTGGNQIGNVQAVANVFVTGGVFSVAVNANDEFGPQAFNGEGRWLQVDVCSDSTCASTTSLGPRQALTGTPYALGPWQMSGTGLGYTDGSVGIGTTSPIAPLHIKTTAPSLLLQDTAIPSDQSGFVSFRNSTGSETGWVGYGSAGLPLFSVVNVRAGGDIQLYTATGATLVAKSSGSVGVGTSSPAAKLDVRGDIRLGSAGEYFAPASGEALRIVRGEILAAGSISAGSGFTLTHPSTGVYNIFFTTPFLATSHPALSVTPVTNSGILIAMASGLPGPSSVTIRVVNGSGTATDGAFSFAVIGAR